MALKINRKLQRFTQILGWVIISILVISIIKLLIWEDNYYTTKTSEKRAEAAPVLKSIQAPLSISDEEVNAENYQTNSGKPRTITIERLGIHARIVEAKVDTSGRLPVPSNINDTAWYAGSSRPGKGSTIIISGLSQGANKKAVFANLDSLEVGDIIKIDISGSDEVFEYEVAEIKIAATQKAESLLPEAQRNIDNKETLSLITALGENSGEYESIVMLRATLKK